MAEFEIFEELADLKNANTEYNEATLNKNRLHLNLSDLEAQIAEGQGDEPKLQEYKKQAQQELNNINISRQAAVSKYQESLKNFKTALGKKLSIKPEEIDFTQSYNQMKPELQKFISSQADEFVENVKKFQEKYGKDKPNEWLKKIEEKALYSLPVLAAMGVVASLIERGGDSDGWFKQHDYNFHANRAVGCYQYHVPSGAIRTMGVCGVEKKCSPLNEEQCNAQTPQGLCQWNSHEKRCTAGSLVTNAQSCSSSCTTNADCNTIDKVACSTPSDCKVGNCVNGTCMSQTCDPNTKTCIPTVPSNPEWKVLDQIENGKIGFCLGDGMGTTCDATTLICDVTTNGGACEACNANDQSCLSPGNEISTVANCMCTNLYGLNKNTTGWITLPICQPADSFLTTISYMNSISNNWVPQKTPLVITVLMWLGIILFFLTLVWYVIYLIKHGKK